MALRAVVVLPAPPAAEGGAGDRTAAGLIVGLGMHGIAVSVVAARPGTSAGRFDNLRAPHRGLATDAVRERLRSAVLDADVIHVEQVEAGWIPAGFALPTSLHVQYRSRLDRDLGAPWTKEFRTAVEARRIERTMIRRHHFLVANSDVVASTLRRDAGARADVTVVPLTLDATKYPVSDPTDEPTAGIIGTASWPPTADALRRLVDGVWPAVLRRAPTATLRIAGRGTDAWRAEGSPGAKIEVIGPVASAPDFLASLGVLVYPVGRGSGMKVKVLECLALGIPVVTTVHGAEGFAPSDGIVIASDDRALADATAELLLDPAARRERGAAGAHDFADRYAPEPATAPLAALLRRMAEG